MACLLGPQFTYHGTAYYEQVQFEDVLVTGVSGTVAEGGAGSGAEMRYVQCILPEGVEAAEAADDAEAADGADGADGTVGGVEAAPTVYHGTTGSLDLELAYISLSRAHCVLPKAVVPAP